MPTVPTRPTPQRPQPKQGTPTETVLVKQISTLPNPVIGPAIWPGKSIMPPEMRHMVLITGHRGSGKTSFVLKLDHPDKLLMLDFESKGETLAAQMKLGAYFPIMSEIAGVYGENFNPQVVYERTVQILRAVPENRFSTLILDNGEYLQVGCAQLIKNNPPLAARYGIDPGNAVSGAYGGAWPGVKYLISGLFQLARSKGIQLIATTFQLKTAWDKNRGGPLFNQFKTTDVDVWHNQSVFTGVLVDPSPKYYPVPRMLVMKESLSDMVWDEVRQETVQARKLPPALPKATPAELYKYLRRENILDMENLSEEEKVDALELAPFKPSFSKEQLFLLERMVRAQEKLGLVPNTSEEGPQ